MAYSRGITALVLLVGAVAALAATPSPAADLPLTPRQGLLLLRNGNVLEGEITQAGDYYVVTLGKTGEIRLAAKEVEAVVASLDEAYDLRRLGLFGGGAGPHLDLAQWCLRNGLHARCAEQLVLAVGKEPENPRIADVERRLNLATTARPPAQPKRPAQPTAARTDDLEKAMRALPKASIEKFAAVVQPVLLNRCGANQCHGPNSKAEFHLLKPPTGQAATQRFTQRNLYSALQYLDPANPDESPLLVLPSKRHGTSLTAVFDKHTQKQFDELKAWARMTIVAPQPAVPATIAAGDQATLSQPASAGESAATHAPRPSLAAPSATPPASSGDHFVPRDPFDPEIFNRRFQVKN